MAGGVLISVIACGDDGAKGESLAALGIDDGASRGESTDALVDASSAVTLQLKTGARLAITEGSTTKQLRVELKRPADREALPLLKHVEPGYKVASAPYVVTPHGATFDKDLELTLPIAKGNTDRLVVAVLDDEKDTTWEVRARPKVSGNTAKLPLRHFSVYVLLESDSDLLDDAGGRDGGSPDASQRDAGMHGGDYFTRILDRLDACGLIAQGGMLKERVLPQNKQQECQADCVLDAACQDVAASFCNTSTLSDALQTCLETCGAFSVVECETSYGTQVVQSCDGHTDCLDGRDENSCPPEAFVGCVDYDEKPVSTLYQCDGDEDCADGADEDGCPAGTHFMCASGERIAALSRCDGYSDCGDASDEAGCVDFACADGAQIVPDDVVCDLTRDCSDGSDEDQGCLKLACELAEAGKSQRRPSFVTASHRKQPRSLLRLLR